LRKEISYRQFEDNTDGRQATRISVYAPTAGEVREVTLHKLI